jgi:hypothetical protein
LLLLLIEQLLSIDLTLAVAAEDAIDRSCCCCRSLDLSLSLLSIDLSIYLLLLLSRRSINSLTVDTPSINLSPAVVVFINLSISLLLIDLPAVD